MKVIKISDSNFNLEIKLTGNLLHLYLHLMEQGYLEYRDPEFDNLEDYLKNEDKVDQDIDRFLLRNENGTYLLAQKLERLSLIKSNTMSWHITYIPVNLSEEFENVEIYDTHPSE